MPSQRVPPRALGQLIVQVDGIIHHFHQSRRGAKLGNQADGMKRRPAGQLPFLHQNNVRAAGFCKVVCDAGAEDTPADNNDLSLVFHCDPPNYSALENSRTRLELSIVVCLKLIRIFRCHPGGLIPDFLNLKIL